MLAHNLIALSLSHSPHSRGIGVNELPYILDLCLSLFGLLDLLLVLHLTQQPARFIGSKSPRISTLGHSVRLRGLGRALPLSRATSKRP